MFEDWEDFDSKTFIPVMNKDEQKSLEERKLVEEADKKLTNELFNQEIKQPIFCDGGISVNTNTNETTINETTINANTNKISKKLENENNLKEISRKQKELKFQRIRLFEIYGEAQESLSKYDEYEDKFEK